MSHYGFYTKVEGSYWELVSSLLALLAQCLSHALDVAQLWTPLHCYHHRYQPPNIEASCHFADAPLGFCGSLTTFSSWQIDIFFSWINETHSHRDWLRDVWQLSSWVFLPSLTPPPGYRWMHQTILHAFDSSLLPDVRRIPRILDCATHSTIATAATTLPLLLSNPVHPHIFRNLSYLLPSLLLLPAPSHRRPLVLLSRCLNPLHPLHQAQPTPQSLTSRDVCRQPFRHRSSRHVSCPPGPAEPSFARCVRTVAGIGRWILRVFDDRQHICGRGHHVEGEKSVGLRGAFGRVGATVGVSDLWAFILGGTCQCAGKLHIYRINLRSMLCCIILLYSNPLIYGIICIAKSRL